MNNSSFTFIDLFAGIGGFRIACQKLGGTCLFSSEIDKYARQTYNANFNEQPHGDIREIDKNFLPTHDLLCAGFPCQPFSLAGVSKKNSLGIKHGFEDVSQGTLFFEIQKILEVKRPKAFLLENVKNLLSHDNGRTFEVIRYILEDLLGYVVAWKIVDSAVWLPQHRERLYIVGFDPKQIEISKDQIDIPMQPTQGYAYPQLHTIITQQISKPIGLRTWNYLQAHKAKHANLGNGFGYSLHTFPINADKVTRTLSARYYKDGSEILIAQESLPPRKLTLKEAMLLQGYDPTTYIFPVSDTQAYKQLGNSVTIPVIKDIVEKIVARLLE